MRHLLLDFGGPVLYSPFELRERGAASMGVDPDELAGGPLDPADVRWQQRIDGVITEREYWEGEAARFGLDAPGYLAHFFEPSGDHLTRPETCGLVDEVRAAGHRVGVLTNDLTAFHGPEWQDPISVFRRFDTIVDLSHTGHLKPDPKAYAVGIDAMGVPAGEIVYVDDHIDNVEGGAAAGLVSVWFDVTDPAGSHQRIREALDG